MPDITTPSSSASAIPKQVPDPAVTFYAVNDGAPPINNQLAAQEAPSISQGWNASTNPISDLLNPPLAVKYNPVLQLPNPATGSCSMPALIPDVANCNPVAFSNPNTKGVSPVGSGQPLTVQGSAGSTGVPTTDVNRQISGTVPGTNVTFRNPA